MGDKVDKHLGTLAARQHGVVATRQLAALGLSRQAVSKRVASGRLHRVHRGVYAVGHPRLSLHGNFFAAVLTCGTGAVLSHLSAAILHRMMQAGSAAVHVTVPSSAGRKRRDGIVVHRAPLRTGETGWVDRIPVTSPARTALDLADVVSRRRVERALDEADYLGLDVSALQPRHGRAGSGRIAAVLVQHEIGSTLTRSDLEEWLLALCDRERLPEPAVNAYVEGKEVDFSWPERRLIVEADGRAAHDTRSAFERDRVRDAELVVAGWRVLRVTHRRLTVEPGAVVRQLRDLLG